MALDANAMLTLAQGKAALEIPSGNTSRDTEIEELISEASTWIESHTKRLLAEQTITEYQDGRAMNRLITKQYPIIGGPAVGGTKPEIFDDPDWVYGTDTQIDTDDYEVTEDQLSITLKKAFFLKGYRNIKVTYKFGVGLVTGATNTFPRDIQLACKKLLQWLDLYDNSRRIGIRARAKGGESVSYEPGMPKLVDQLLEPYVRVEFNAGNVATRND